MSNNTKPYLLFEQLINEKSSIVLDSLLGKKLDFTKLRTIACQLHDYDPEQYAFSIDGTDAELWQSVREVLSKF